MPVNRKPIFDAVKQLRRGQPYLSSEVLVLDKAIDEAIATGKPDPAPLTKAPLPAVAVPLPATPQFKYGTESMNKLQYLHPKLRQAIELSIGYSPIDNRVNQTLRSVTEQKAAVAAGNSRTMKSKHLKQPDGWVWAVDLVALKDLNNDGKEDVDWRFDDYAGIAYAVDRAATELGFAGHIRWGCAWDRVLSDFGGQPAAYLAEARAYAARHPGSDLLDAPHFEWVA
jgi:peptidoglycan L-alanyl-D-glutamate endopeptidase CwlK